MRLLKIPALPIDTLQRQEGPKLEAMVQIPMSKFPAGRSLTVSNEAGRTAGSIALVYTNTRECSYDQLNPWSPAQFSSVPRPALAQCCKRAGERG